MTTQSPADALTITINGEPHNITRGQTLREVIAQEQITLPNDECVGAKMNNKIADLNRVIREECEIELFGLRSRDGMMMYQRSLVYVLVMACQEVYPDLNVYVNHTLGDGFFCELHAPKYHMSDPVEIRPADLNKIKAVMQRLIDENIPFERTQVTLDEAREIFRQNGQQDKLQLLKYRRDQQISLYKCDGAQNHFCGYLIPRTGLLQCFDLTMCEPGFLLRYPDHNDPQSMREFKSYPKLFSVYREYEEWGKILGLETVAQLNEVIEEGGISEFIKVAESLQEKKLARIADMITNRDQVPRVILISGPSSSGKTTFSKRLAVHLRVNGHRSVIMSLDDFFVDRHLTPRDANGDYDFEAFETIDSKLFAQCVRDLLRGDSVPMPKFNFKSGTSERGENLTLDPDQVLIVEGIHGLNPRLLPSVPEGMKYRIFVSALTQLNIDNHNRIASSDTRMIRRIVRDSQYRGYSAKETISRWPSVRRGEGQHIFPFQEEADHIFNTALTYELCVLKQFAMPILEEVSPEATQHSEARRLLYLLSYFHDIDVNEVPRHSLLREFIGGSSFDY